MATVPTEGLEGSASSAVCYIDFAVSGTAAGQEPGLGGRVVQEAHVPHSAVVHVELHLVAHQLVGLIVESHVFDGFVIRSGGNEFPIPGPASTVYGASVVLCPLAEHRWRIGRRLLAIS